MFFLSLFMAMLRLRSIHKKRPVGNESLVNLYASNYVRKSIATHAAIEAYIGNDDIQFVRRKQKRVFNHRANYLTVPDREKKISKAILLKMLAQLHSNPCSHS